jgi:DNA-binding transcriptional LysR family regulator
MPKQARVSNSTPLIDVQKLRYFAEIAACGSFSRAGIKLALAQSALSRHIHELELQLGQPLFYRTGRGVVATDFGEYILPRVRALLFEVEQFSGDIATESGVVRGKVRLAILRSLSDLLLTPLLMEISRLFPAIEMHVMEGLTDHLEEWLATGRADLGVVYKNRKDQLKSEFLTSSDLHLISKNGDIGTRNSTISLREVASLPMVLPALPNRLRQTIEDACAMKGITLLITLHLDSIQTTKDLVMMGGYYSILPPHAIYRDIADGKLSASRIVEPSITREIHLEWSNQCPKSRAGHEVAMLLRRHIKDHIRSGLFV